MEAAVGGELDDDAAAILETNPSLEVIETSTSQMGGLEGSQITAGISIPLPIGVSTFNNVCAEMRPTGRPSRSASQKRASAFSKKGFLRGSRCSRRSSSSTSSRGR